MKLSKEDLVNTVDWLMGAVVWFICVLIALCVIAANLGDTSFPLWAVWALSAIMQALYPIPVLPDKTK